MAQLYQIVCPKCGHEFNVTKGVMMRWDPSKPIPAELRDEPPFECPKCKHTMCVLDDGFNDHVQSVMFMD